MIYATAIFVISFSIIASLQFISLRSIDRSNRLTFATYLTSSVLEELLSQKVSGLAGSGTFFYNAQGMQVSSSNYYDVSYTTYPSSDGFNYVDIEVQTKWKLTPDELNAHQIKLRARKRIPGTL